MFFTEEYLPRLDDYDRAGRLSYEAILQILENIGAHHAMRVSDSVAAGGVAWMLLDWRVAVTRRPAPFVPLRLRTWSRGKASAVTTDRDFLVTDGEGQEFLRATARFALVDVRAQKMVRISDELTRAYEPEAERVFPDDAPRLREPEAYDVVLPVALRRSDIDYNGHVHNTRYISLALEALPEAAYRADDFRLLRIVYRAPVRADSRPEIRRAAAEDGWRFTIAAADGTVCTLMELRK